MDLLEAIKGRASTRAFLDRPVAKETIHEVLEAARWAPSGTNTQPWQVAVVAGEIKEQISNKIVEKFTAGEESAKDYQYYPETFTEPYRSRRVACGKALYGALGIERKDRERRKQQWVANYHGFGAPVELFIFIDGGLEKGSWVDMGMFIQNIMLAARAFDLETCAQAAMAEYPDIVRNALDIPDSLKLICGIAIGYPDRDDPVNQYRTEREEVDRFTNWYGLE
ncbi:MAG: nitroreductase family protein [Verrucomicrobiales bacterium]|nr:nitroreductase family protein [Verrucomicrobiales bacterium]